MVWALSLSFTPLQSWPPAEKPNAKALLPSPHGPSAVQLPRAVTFPGQESFLPLGNVIPTWALNFFFFSFSVLLLFHPLISASQTRTVSPLAFANMWPSPVPQWNDRDQRLTHYLHTPFCHPLSTYDLHAPGTVYPDGGRKENDNTGVEV